MAHGATINPKQGKKLKLNAESSNQMSILHINNGRVQISYKIILILIETYKCSVFCSMDWLIVLGDPMFTSSLDMFLPQLTTTLQTKGSTCF